MRQLMFPALLLLMTLISACAPVKLPREATYTLSSTKATAIPAHSTSDQTLAIATPTASPGFQTAHMVYMITPFELSTFARSSWVAPPAQMLIPMMVQALRAKGYYKAIVLPPLLSQTNYRLDLQVLRLQQEFLLPTSKVRLEIQATLLDGVSNRVISSNYFATVLNTNNNTPYGGVLAASRAADDLSRQIAAWCVKHSLH